MEELLDIRDVARRTGLTSRALRFYEARGLLKPLRTYSGRRLYGRVELERIQQILALKRAGLSLAQIGKLTAHGNMDLRSIVEAQLKVIEERKAELDEARSLLLSIKSRIDRGEPVDAATFCSLIREGDKIMQPEDWKKVTDRYFQRKSWSIGRSTRRKRVSTKPNTAGSGRISATGCRRRSRKGRTAPKRKRFMMSGGNCSHRSRRWQRPR